MRLRICASSKLSATLSILQAWFAGRGEWREEKRKNCMKLKRGNQREETKERKLKREN